MRHGCLSPSVAASSIAGRVSLICLLISSMDSLYQHGDRFYDPTSLLSWCVFHRRWRGLMPPVHSALPMWNVRMLWNRYEMLQLAGLCLTRYSYRSVCVLNRACTLINNSVLVIMCCVPDRRIPSRDIEHFTNTNWDMCSLPHNTYLS